MLSLPGPVRRLVRPGSGRSPPAHFLPDRDFPGSIPSCGAVSRYGSQGDITFYVRPSPILLDVYTEHIFYSAALAVIVGMVFSRYTGRDPSWVILFVTFVPDMSKFLDLIKKPFSSVPLFHIGHGALHTLPALLLFSVLFAIVLRQLFGLWFSDALVCTFLGYAAHFFEDALVYNPSYAFLWPVYPYRLGIGILQENPDILGIADSSVLAVGMVLLAGALLVRTYVEGAGWWRVFLRGGREDRPASS